MTTKAQIAELDKAYKAKLISTDEYCSQLTPLLKKHNQRTQNPDNMKTPKFSIGQVVTDEFGRNYDVVAYVRPNVVCVSNQLTKSDRIIREIHEDFLSPYICQFGKQDFGKF